jgi:hypothetical protein
VEWLPVNDPPADARHLDSFARQLASAIGAVTRELLRSEGTLSRLFLCTKDALARELTRPFDALAISELAFIRTVRREPNRPHPLLGADSRLFAGTIGSFERSVTSTRGALEDIVVPVAGASDVTTIDSTLGTRDRGRQKRHGSREARYNQRLEAHQTLRMGG